MSVHAELVTRADHQPVCYAAAESTNARVKWMSLITNVVLVGIAFGQVIYIRSMLESGY